MDLICHVICFCNITKFMSHNLLRVHHEGNNFMCVTILYPAPLQSPMYIIQNTLEIISEDDILSNSWFEVRVMKKNNWEDNCLKLCERNCTYEICIKYSMDKEQTYPSADVEHRFNVLIFQHWVSYLYW